MDEWPDYFRYWGKAQQSNEQGVDFHLLVYHCLDVAAVVAEWWASSPAICRSFCSLSDLTTEQTKAWMLFFTALHDYGKFDVRFQFRSKPAWHLLHPESHSYGLLPSEYDCKHYYHGESGLFWFMRDHDVFFGLDSGNVTEGLDFLDDPIESPSERWLLWKVWLESVTGHHGHIKPAECVPDMTLPSDCDRRFADLDRKARTQWFEMLAQIFLKPVGLSLEDSPPPCSPLMAGLCSVADWLGSRCNSQNFSYRSQATNLEAYFEEKLDNDAYRILEFAGVISRPQTYSDVNVLLKKGHIARSVQTLVDDMPLKAGLTIVEAPTGSGKTEAALSYAWRLVDAGFADSIVFALPTQATANAMLGRIEQLATKLFGEHPNVLLAHGSARFNKEFVALKHAGLEGYEKEDGWVQCSEWLAESRKRVFLGQIGVCTVDQVLISVLPVRHRFVRGFGLGRSVLIVDEVHAYDAYMYGLLEEVLKQQKEAGGSVILLSATLPEQQRRQLCTAWSAILDNQEEDVPYPLVTWTDGGVTTPIVLDPVQRPNNVTVKLEPLLVSEMKPDDSLLRRVVVAAEAGAQVAIVCNLVDVAQGLVRAFQSMTSVKVDLFHARYCYSHRREKELAAIQYFGPDGERSEGRILVATQVVEQSLDVDFDWLITQLCPIDLLFQRIGRLHRHVRSNRPSGFETPCCTVLLPKDDDYGLHGLIYANTRVLWRTAMKILSASGGNIVFPDAYRTWIEPVYRDKPWGTEPEAVEKGYEKFKYEIEEIQRYKARFMVKTAMNPFADTDEHVMAMTRDGDMNLVVVPYCWTTKGKRLMDGTMFELLDEYSQLECLALNSVGVPKSWQRYFEESEEGRYWLAMEQNGDGYRGCSKGVTFHYHKDMGLEKEK
ncbi:CRISPR-associated helicase, Cas3 family [Syntrophus gentianae]|uniref:CRISPR-associated helicase, Cas3 family n=1 Tax=Syntrophus gentianae TaxID=43775 RepID=A0A1H8A7Q9_9BACT|nr:CRISPR-associated helicase/endonuclease Cas3 [Syntrophus gentianae]SEM66720.1 CRISPR-associated helicase, Cas3 family [Syntrophus gentianae]